MVNGDGYGCSRRKCKSTKLMGILRLLCNFLSLHADGQPSSSMAAGEAFFGQGRITPRKTWQLSDHTLFGEFLSVIEGAD